ncbi:hypothetical protein [Bradyrhizobium sp. Rc2d]|uniref:hypothetical protein n=1 Tax=Bradyrhizobium sp. Rc2d TaxID=1855321 RepID=UPI00115FE51E|nr:hypothetical protein [Bradyrhizobium sp. Rc2d]
MRHLDHAALADLETLGNLARGGISRAIPLRVTGAASLLLIHPIAQIQKTYPAPAAAILMMQLTPFFAVNGIILPHGAAASISVSMTHADAEFIADVFASFIDSHRDVLGTIQVRK